MNNTELRDLFAIAALPSIMEQTAKLTPQQIRANNLEGKLTELQAAGAYVMADAMLEARKLSKMGG